MAVGDVGGDGGVVVAARRRGANESVVSNEQAVGTKTACRLSDVCRRFTNMIRQFCDSSTTPDWTRGKTSPGSAVREMRCGDSQSTIPKNQTHADKNYSCDKPRHKAVEGTKCVGRFKMDTHGEHEPRRNMEATMDL